MTPYECLTKRELDMIGNYIDYYGSRNGTKASFAPMDRILSYWNEEKATLFDIFGQKLILTKYISYEKGANEIEKGMDTLKRHSDFYENWSSVAWEVKHQYDGDIFDYDNIYYKTYRVMSDLMTNAILAANRWLGGNTTIVLPNRKTFTINEGAKVSKIICKIAKAYNIEGAEEFRIAHSQVLNDKSVSGDFCLSIHPLDYMTMSDNDCGWSSCMSWREYGDYRQGTVEMMNSPIVIVAYLKSSTDYACGGIEWNSKRWRELFVVHDGVIAGIKGYPYINRNIEKKIIDWIKELIPNKYEDKFCLYDAGNEKITYEGGMNQACQFFNFQTNLMYNDFYYEHTACLAKDKSKIPEIIEYSGVSECMASGEILENWDTEKDLFDSEYDPCYRCVECGEYVDPDYAIQVDGELYCEYCASNVIDYCRVCDEAHHYDFIYTLAIGVTIDGKVHLSDVETLVCKDCLNQIRDVVYEWEPNYNYIDINDITDNIRETYFSNTFYNMEELRKFKNEFIQSLF